MTQKLLLNNKIKESRTANITSTTVITVCAKKQEQKEKVICVSGLPTGFQWQKARNLILLMHPFSWRFQVNLTCKSVMIVPNNNESLTLLCFLIYSQLWMAYRLHYISLISVLQSERKSSKLVLKVIPEYSTIWSNSIFIVVLLRPLIDL